MKYTEEQLSKLPKWAQVEIGRLTKDLEMCKADLRRIDGEGVTNTFIEDGLDKHPLPVNTSIIFGLKENKNQVRCYIPKHEDCVYISTDSRIGGTMQLQLVASNSFKIEFKQL